MKHRVLLMINVAGVFCMLLYLSACAHQQVNTEPLLNFSRSDMKYKNVYVFNFTVSPKGVEEKEPGSILADSRSNCINEMIKSELFENVKYGSAVEAPNSGLLVQGEVTKLRIVGGAARFWIGAMAGKSNMTVRVKLVDASTGSIVAENDIIEDTNPYAGAWSMGASDSSLPATVGRLIAQYVAFSSRK